MMELTDFTSYAAIRAVLGVTEKDLADETLEIPLYLDSLIVDLEDVSLSFLDAYTEAQEAPNPTPAQERFLRATRTFSTYSVAKQLVSSMGMFGVKTVSDGKATMTRFDNPLNDVLKRIMSDYERWRLRLEKSYEDLGHETSTGVDRPFLSVISPSYDPVTGEG